MSNMIYRLLPHSWWVLCAIEGTDKEFRTFRISERDRAIEWIKARPFREIKILAANPNRIMFGNPTLADLREVIAIGIRAKPSQAKALKALNPAEAFPYRDKFVAVWRLRRGDGKPVTPAEANAAEQAIADRFGAVRLNFFVPIPPDNRIEVFSPRCIEPKDVASFGVSNESDEELSASSDPRHRSWAIEPLVQRKKTTLISGNPGMGKSQIALDIAMRVTRGIGLPGQPAPMPAGVLISETEDDWDEDVIPRLIANGANRKLIMGVSIRNLNTREGVARLDSIKRKFEADIGLPVGLLILSPYMEGFGKGSAQEEHMRQRLLEFKEWERQANLGTLGVAHLNEEGDVAGAKTFKRSARASWKVLIDGTDNEPVIKKKRRLLVCDKANNTEDDFMLAYRIEGVKLQGGFKTSKIVWEDPNFRPKETLQEAAQDSTSRGVTEYVAAYLKERLKNGPIDGKILVQEVMDMGYSEGTAHNAKKLLGIPNTGRGKTSPWVLP